MSFFNKDNFEFCQDNMPPRGILLSHNRSFATMFGPTNDPQLVRKEAEEAEEGGAAPAGQGCVEREAQELGLLNTTLTAQMSADLVKWKLHDDNQNSFCDVDDEDLQVAVLFSPFGFPFFYFIAT